MPKRQLITFSTPSDKESRILGIDGHLLNLIKDIDQKTIVILYTNLKH